MIREAGESLRLAHRGDQVPQFGVDFGGIGHRIADRCAQVPAKATSQPAQNDCE